MTESRGFGMKRETNAEMNVWRQVRSAIKRLFRLTMKLKMPATVAMKDERASYRYTFGPREWRRYERKKRAAEPTRKPRKRRRKR